MTGHPRPEPADGAHAMASALPLAGKVAVVTGGSRGIGRAVVERLCHDGAAVVFSFLHAADAAAELGAAVAARGGRAAGVRADQGDVAAMRTLFDEAEERFGGVDAFVANAAVGGVRRLDEITEAEFARAVDVNVKGTLFGTQEAGRRLRDGGRIVYISTVNTVLRAPGLSLYAATKGAVEQLAAVAALELAPRGITVNVVSPGATDTDAFHAANPGLSDEAVAAFVPLGRLGTPADVADVVGFLLGDDARWLTGQHLRASGGMELGGARGRRRGAGETSR